MQNMGTVDMMERTFSMQLEFINVIRKLIVYDKEHAEVPEKTKFLESFCDTQEKALDIAMALLTKHKDGLLHDEEEAKKAEQAKREAERAKSKQEKQQEKEKAAIQKDLEKAKTDADSLFSEWSESE